MTERSFADSIFIDRNPEEVYDLVADVTRTGEWSPICRACWWDDENGPTTGSWFSGRNETADRTWTTRSQVVAADRGREFAWMVNNGRAKWAYQMAALAGGTELTETWHFTETGITEFEDTYGEQAAFQIENRTAAAHQGIPLTLAAIKRIAESG